MLAVSSVSPKLGPSLSTMAGISLSSINVLFASSIFSLSVAPAVTFLVPKAVNLFSTKVTVPCVSAEYLSSLPMVSKNICGEVLCPSFLNLSCSPLSLAM